MGSSRTPCWRATSWIRVAGRTGSEWIGRTLLVGGILIALLLVGLLGVMLLYRRMVPVIERRAAVRVADVHNH